jgi:hypothetical protein
MHKTQTREQRKLSRPKHIKQEVGENHRMMSFLHENSSRMRWVGHVAHMGDEKCLRNFSRKTRREESNLKS